MEKKLLSVEAEVCVCLLCRAFIQFSSSSFSCFLCILQTDLSTVTKDSLQPLQKSDFLSLSISCAACQWLVSIFFIFNENLFIFMFPLSLQMENCYSESCEKRRKRKIRRKCLFNFHLLIFLNSSSFPSSSSLVIIIFPKSHIHDFCRRLTSYH